LRRSLHPEYREVLNTYATHQECRRSWSRVSATNGTVNLKELEKAVDDETACVLIQSPNFFGTIEDVAAIAEIAHKRGALLIVSIAEAVSLGIVEPPREADIVAMEAQSFGVPLGFGGPYCGVLATREKFVRQMPGRLAGQTVDKNGKRGFVLTLATREQHIRREKATSNICTNQALVALMVNIFMTVYGKVGCANWRSRIWRRRLMRPINSAKHAKVLFAGAPRFNEFVVQTSEDPYAINSAVAGTQDRWRAAAEEVLSGAWECGAVVLHGVDHALDDRYGGGVGGRERTIGADDERC
jgi:glycine dehydrogenase subunit 1